MSTWPRDPVTKRFLKRSEMPPVDVRVTDDEPVPPVNRRLTLADLGRIADEANARVEDARKAFEAAELELSEAENAATVAVAALKVKL